MKKYIVRLYYHTFVDVVVTAEDKDEAVDNAYNEVEGEKYDELLLCNMVTEDTEVDVEELKED